jgi:hypothetical protein
LDFRSNDTLRADYWLTNYYAYDDGLADYSVALTAYGNRAAYLFEMLTTQPDTLTGFDIYYPDYGVPSNLIVDFAVYNDIDGLPGIPIYTLPSQSISRNGSKFKRVKFGERFLVRINSTSVGRHPSGERSKLASIPTMIQAPNFS